MIKTAQKRFILITLSILITIFTAIFAVIWGINRANFTREVQFSLENVEREYSERGAFPQFKKIAIIEIDDLGGTEQIGADAVSSEILDKITEKVNDGENVGKVENAYFSAQRKGAKTVVSVADMQVETERYHSVIIKTLILLVSAFAVLAIVVWGLSSKVFEPIKRILAKQKQFISDASHELKTPVAIISANTDVIATEDNKPYTDSIKKQVERLKFLVNDLLTLARLDEGNTKSVKEAFNLSDEVLNVTLPFDAVAFEKGKTLKCDVEKDVIYEGSKDGVKQILNVLLDNAIKYSADGGEIIVSLKKSGARTELSVYNDGSDVKQEDSEKIFERFYRGDASRSRDSGGGGNGLGLSIAKGIATANKWTISAQSVFGKSMTMTLIL